MMCLMFISHEKTQMLHASSCFMLLQIIRQSTQNQKINTTFDQNACNLQQRREYNFVFYCQINRQLWGDRSIEEQQYEQN